MKMTAMWKSITAHNLDYILGKLADKHGSFLFTTSVPGFVYGVMCLLLHSR
jgi:hypothetical protein